MTEKTQQRKAKTPKPYKKPTKEEMAAEYAKRKEQEKKEREKKRDQILKYIKRNRKKKNPQLSPEFLKRLVPETYEFTPPTATHMVVIKNLQTEQSDIKSFSIVAKGKDAYDIMVICEQTILHHALHGKLRSPIVMPDTERKTTHTVVVYHKTLVKNEYGAVIKKKLSKSTTVSVPTFSSTELAVLCYERLTGEMLPT